MKKEKQQAYDERIEKWLREEVVPACKALQRGETQGVSGDEVRSSLRAMQEQVAGEEPYNLEDEIREAFERYDKGERNGISDEEMNRRMAALRSALTEGRDSDGGCEITPALQRVKKQP